MTAEALSFWITKPGQGEIRTTTLPASTTDTVQVRTLFTGISRGTESLVFRGEVPESEYVRMRAPFQEGDFPGPVKYGYIATGIVERGPEALLGRPVFCLHPHQTRFVVPADQVTLLPDSVPASRAVLTANLETAINGLWDASPSLGDRIAVVGAGAVGCLVAWLAGQIPGCEVELIDIDPSRQLIANALGVDFATPEAARTEADLVVHTSGSEQGLGTALRLAAFEATVLEMSWYGRRQCHVALGEAFHMRRLQLKSSQVGQVATTQRARWDYQRRLQLALSLLSDPVLDQLITSESAFADLPETLARLASTPDGTICHRITYS